MKTMLCAFAVMLLSVSALSDPILTMDSANRFPDEMVCGYDQKFSTRKFLKEIYSPFIDVEIKGEKAYKIVYKYCEKYNINQRYILTVLQREQSLILCKFTGKELKHRLDRATGYGVSDVDAEKSKPYLGFERQVRNACRVSKKLWKQYKKDPPRYLLIEEKREKKRWGKFPNFQERMNNQVKIVQTPSAVTAMIWAYTPLEKAPEGTVAIWIMLFQRLQKN